VKKFAGFGVINDWEVIPTASAIKQWIAVSGGTLGDQGVVSIAVGAALVFGFGFCAAAGEESLSMGQGAEEEGAGVVRRMWL